MGLRPNLVLLRAGDTSIHPAWLQVSRERNWDLIVNYFGDDPDIFRDHCIRIDNKGAKLPGLFECITNNRELLTKYRYIWLPDDDLACKGDDITKMFELVESGGYQLAQPSLTHDSYFSHALTVHNPMFKMRYTSFIEIMAPCFESGFLDHLLPTFNLNISGWGVDHLWSQMLRSSDVRVGVIDEIQIRHTRPVGGGQLYSLLKGRTAEEEMAELFELNKVPRRYLKIHSAVTTSGKALSHGFRLWILHGMGLLSAGRKCKMSRFQFLHMWTTAMWHQLVD